MILLDVQYLTEVKHSRGEIAKSFKLAELRKMCSLSLDQLSLIWLLNAHR